MSFAENLQYLRRKNRITQEQLAEELNVSRQSVSKWETGEAYPETEKIIMLCDKFDVTMDALLRGDVRSDEDMPNSDNETDNEAYNETITKFSSGIAKKKEFIEHMDKFSKRIGIAVTLIIIGAALIVAFANADNAVPKAVVIIGLVIAALSMCAAIFLFITSRIVHDNFQRRAPKMDEVLSEEEKKVFEKKFAVRMASLISVLILSAIALALTFSFGEEIIVGYYELVAVAVFLFVISFIIGGICYMGIQHQKFDIREYNREARHLREPHKGIGNVWEAVCGAIMLTAAAAYILMGFVWNLWHPGWVVFPVGGIICAIITTFQKVLNKGEKSNAENDTDDKDE